MTTTDHELELEVPASAIERGSEHVRTFETELVEGDGRTIEGRIVPYDEPALVADGPHGRPYREQFARGAFERQLSAPNRVRVLLNFEHDQGLRGIVGHAVALEDRGDALYGRFRALNDPDGDKALSLVNEGLLRGLSLEFAAIKSRIVDGVVTRTRAHVDKVSLCRFPAYANAAVLAVREEPEGDDDDLEPDDEPGTEAPAVAKFERVDPIPDEVLERLQALGIETDLERLGGRSS